MGTNAGQKKEPTDASVAPELDLESQLDDIASALNFDLDDDLELDDDEGLEAAEAGLDAAQAELDAEPESEVAQAPAEEASEEEEEEEEALELDDLDVEELDSMSVVEDFSDLEAEPEPLGPLYLIVDDEYAVVDQERFVIGRVSKMCDLAIIDVNVSRQHCAIERREDGYYIVDQGSTNGVLLDGKKIDNHRIEEGEQYVLSSHRVVATFVAPVQSVAYEEPEPVPQSGTPDVTGRMKAVPVSEPEPVAQPAQSGGIELIPSEPLPPLEPMPQVETEPPSEQPAVVHQEAAQPVAQHPAEQQQVAYDPAQYGTFEERVEMRLENLAQQIAYVQQQNELLSAQVEQLRGVASLAEMIQQRLAARGGKL
ncbi:MAG: FHA domain-containing protein [Myxococcota bacterium]